MIAAPRTNWSVAWIAGPLSLLLAVEPIDSIAQFWQEIPIEAPDDVTSDGQFGAALDVEGDLLLIGAPGTDAGAPGSGSAYLYQRNAEGLQTWGFVQRLLPPSPFTEGAFGTQVMFHDDAIFISAPRERVAGVTCGAVHVYRYNTLTGNWLHEQTVTPDIAQWELFAGAGLAGAQDLLIAYAPGFDADPADETPGRGALLTFLPDGDGLFQATRNVPGDELVPTVVAPSLQGWSGACGNSVYYVGNDAKAYSMPQELLRSAIDPLPAPTPVLLSAPFDPTDPSLQILNGCSDGNSIFLIASVPQPTTHAVCVNFEWIDGDLVQQGYFVSDTTNNDLIWKWGTAVSAGNGSVIVGDPGDLTFTPLGYAEVFQHDLSSTTQWSRIGLLLPSDPEYGARFGLSVAVGDGFAVVGAPEQGEEDRGKVYGFVDPLAGVATHFADPGLCVYPVPVRSDTPSAIVHIDLPNVPGALQLVTTDGRSIDERSVTGPVTWDLGREAAGSYIITWRPRDGVSWPRSSRFIVLP